MKVCVVHAYMYVHIFDVYMWFPVIDDLDAALSCSL